MSETAHAWLVGLVIVTISGAFGVLGASSYYSGVDKQTKKIECIKKTDSAAECALAFQ